MGETTLEITELPVRKWTQDYKEFLEGMVKPDEKDAVRPPPLVHHTHTKTQNQTVQFERALPFCLWVIFRLCWGV